MRDSEAESGSTMRMLGRVVGREELVAGLCGNAWTVVVDVNCNPSPLPRHLGGNGYCSPFCVRHGIARILDQI